MVTESGAPGRVVAGRYRLQSQLGQGGMGTVWLATDAVLGREVAVKEVLFPPYLATQEYRLLFERTMREARAAARFKHPQVTAVHDVIEQDGRPWIVMEHVPSKTLAQVVQENGPIPAHLVAQIGIDLLGGLHAAHEAGIVHRDVKPGNVLIGMGWHAWLTDFGIATSSGDTSLTGTGLLLGSPSYMAPERIRDEEPDPAVDLWSLGATLFTAVEGRPPFERGDPMATLLAVTTEPPPEMPAAGSLAPVLTGLLTKDPARRLTAEQARAGLERALAEPVGTAPYAQPRPAAADAESRERGNRVERLDPAELSSIARDAAKRLAGTTVRKIARNAASSAAIRLGGAPQPRPGPAPARHPRPPNRRARRFRRRWVMVPLVLVGIVLALLVGVGLVLLILLGDMLGG